MKRKEYSAGTTKLSFWFSEFRKVIGLLNSGKTLLEINIEQGDRCSVSKHYACPLVFSPCFYVAPLWRIS